jgi:hypothetical protein
VCLEDTNQIAPLFRPGEVVLPVHGASLTEFGPTGFGPEHQPGTDLHSDSFAPTAIDSITDSGALRYQDISLVLRYTRRWIHYGMMAHILICTLVAAIEGILFRLFRFS